MTTPGPATGDAGGTQQQGQNQHTPQQGQQGQQGQQSGQQQGQQGQTQQTPPDPTRTQGLVDDTSTGDQGGQQTPQQQTSGTGQQGQTPQAPQQGQQGSGQGEQGPADLQQLEERIAARFQSEIDRRINQVVNKGKTGGRQSGQQQGSGDGSVGDDGGQGDQGGQQQPGPSQADTREARMVYREYVGDEIAFLSADERGYAQDLASGLISDQLASGSDAETTGRQVAATVADRVKRLRAMYESRTVDALRRRGALVEREGQPAPGANQAPDQSSFSRGESKARELFGDRAPAGAGQQQQ